MTPIDQLFTKARIINIQIQMIFQQIFIICFFTFSKQILCCLLRIFFSQKYQIFQIEGNKDHAFHIIHGFDAFTDCVNFLFFHMVL